MRLCFRYKEVRLEDGSVIRRPIIPITLSHDGKVVTVEAIIDSGSDYSLIPKEIAEDLGLVLGKSLTEICGIGDGKCKTVQSNVNVMVTDGRKTVRLLNMPIGVLAEGEIEEILIGRIPFFAEFDVTFAENSNRIELIRAKRR